MIHKELNLFGKLYSKHIIVLIIITWHGGKSSKVILFSFSIFKVFELGDGKYDHQLCKLLVSNLSMLLVPRVSRHKCISRRRALYPWSRWSRSFEAWLTLHQPCRSSNKRLLKPRRQIHQWGTFPNRQTNPIDWRAATDYHDEGHCLSDHWLHHLHPCGWYAQGRLESSAIRSKQ